jgi:DNA repair exonuclease SbcCD ATPase subunit
VNITIGSITVEAFRGVPDSQKYHFDGKNIVIQGPNGSGKSTALQAIEFLLTGNISALRGSGTGGIKKKKHIPNLDADPSDTVVRAILKDSNGEFQIYRRFTNRSKIVAERRPAAFDELVELANRGFLQLTREDILELVLTTPSNRKEEIYQLLDTGDLDDRRLRLKGIQREASQSADRALAEVQDTIDRIESLTNNSVSVNRGSTEQSLDTEALLLEINKFRKQLNAAPVSTLPEDGSFANGVEPPVEQASHPLQREDVRRDIDILRSWIDDVEEHQMALDHTRRAISTLQADSDALASLSELSLIQQGRQFVDEGTTTCPLCDAEWESETLRNRLETREKRLQRIEQRRDELKTQSDELLTIANEPIQPLQRLLQISDEVDEVDWKPIQRFIGILQAITRIVEGDIVENVESVDVSKLNTQLEEIIPQDTLKQLDAKAERFPDRSELQRMWDDLTTLSDCYLEWQTATENARHYEAIADGLEVAKREYIAARDDVLGQIFEDVSERFGEFYSLVNPDESSFNPTLGQTNTGVDFTVGFYEEGHHPPNALHSEGHQDLMGVALFLALVDRFSPFDRTPILLDDVFMSVDSTHRERIAEVISSQLSDRFQFVITTHDESWADQLYEANAVSEQNIIKINGWTPTEGPKIESKTD